MNYTNKVCPVILRKKEGIQQILAFRHPLAGRQLMKGTLEPGERPAEAVLRELAEESGISQAVAVEKIGELDIHQVEEHWHIFLCRPNVPLQDEWSFFTLDGGGLTFEFFWHALDVEPDASWHQIFKTALAFTGSWHQQRQTD
jgi:8-oxo-dGTP pyrophosphatase MutT (NUDIX family)